MTEHMFPIRGNPPEAMYPVTIQELAEFYAISYHRVYALVKKYLDFGIDVIASAGIFIVLPSGVLKLNALREGDNRKNGVGRLPMQIPLSKRRKAYYGAEDFSNIEKRIQKMEDTLSEAFTNKKTRNKS